MHDYYRSETLVQDSIHGYISIASPSSSRLESERFFERDLIDSPWVQRLRQIRQLQTAWLVYPTAEHSRFQHVLGRNRGNLRGKGRGASVALLKGKRIAFDGQKVTF